uniref:FGFR1 oncogene partner (FOP) N-terminal dimerisation domain-containing protein n=1 Tax=Heliothis virescens TaxID=7102 RepID=A0A2A4JU02_HELVI
MAQAEDTELRDLVIEALERNGSLAKIRALLRANIFLAFEDECDNLKQNVNLDNILKLPEGIIALSVVHEFLEFCCLKNTLFVYMSESRQGNEYNYSGKKKLSEKLNIPKCDNLKEPLLLTLIKNMLLPHQKKFYDSNAISNYNNHEQHDGKNYREEQNCTYILHEDSQSSTTSNSQSDNSSDEKNKLHLRLQLDNSDTDTSSDSARDKTSSEYIPGDHILQMESNSNQANHDTQKSNDPGNTRSQNMSITYNRPKNDTSLLMNELKLTTNSSSDSTSYLDLKPFNSLDEKMLNTAGLPIVETHPMDQSNTNLLLGTNVQNDLSPAKSGTLSSNSVSHKQENVNKVIEVSEKKSQESGKSEGDTAEFSYGDDFSSSPVSKIKENIDQPTKSLVSTQDALEKSLIKNSTIESPHQTSQSSQSSVSISDVADLISEKSSLSVTNNRSKISESNHSKGISDHKQSKVHSDDSGDFTESPIPSLSNLSLDIHSD